MKRKYSLPKKLLKLNLSELKASIISKQIKAENEKKLSQRTLEELRVYSLGYTPKTPDKS